MLELHIADTDVSSGSIPVAWCVDKDTLASLQEHGAKDPVLVIITAPSGERYHESKELRRIVPLRDLLAYVEFRCAGPNKIWAFMVQSRNAAQVFLEKWHGSYSTTVLSRKFIECNDEDCDDCDRCNPKQDIRLSNWDNRLNFYGRVERPTNDLFSQVSEPIAVDVPADAFAKKPPKWEQDWVGWLFNKAPVDQCEYRRRRIFAYTVQPLLMLLNLAMRLLITIFCLLFGFRNWSPRYLLHPLDIDLDDCSGAVGGGSYFLGQTENTALNLVRVPLMPVFWPFYYLIGRYHAVPGFLTVLGCTVCGILILPSLLAARALMYDRYEKYRDGQPAWFLDQSEQDLILCNGEKKSLTVGQLPFKKRTVRLRFQNIKSKICRPFSS